MVAIVSTDEIGADLFVGLTVSEGLVY